jgi:hypothetical protein
LRNVAVRTGGDQGLGDDVQSGNSGYDPEKLTDISQSQAAHC